MKDRQDINLRDIALTKASMLANHNVIRPEDIIGEAEKFYRFMSAGRNLTDEEIQRDRF